MRCSKTHSLSWLSHSARVLECSSRRHGWDCSSLDKLQTQLSQTQLQKEKSLLFVIRMLWAPLMTAGVSDDVAQEDADWPTNVGRCGRTDAITSCRTQRSRHSGSTRAGSAQSDHISRVISGTKCVSNLEDATLHNENNRKPTQCCHNFNLTSASWEMEALCRLRGALCWEQTLAVGQMVDFRQRVCQPSTARVRLPLPAFCVVVLLVPCARAHLDASCHFWLQDCRILESFPRIP